MEKYKELEMEIIEFQQEDVIMSSCTENCNTNSPDVCLGEDCLLYNA